MVRATTVMYADNLSDHWCLSAVECVRVAGAASVPAAAIDDAAAGVIAACAAVAVGL